MTMMKAVRIHTYGRPEVLCYVDAPRPTIDGTQVLIRVHAVAVNPLDWKLRSRYFAHETGYPLPLILGFDVAGVIEAVGTNVTNFAIGDEVYGCPDTGGYAEYVTVPARDIAHKPRTLNYVQAAAIPAAALTAWQALFAVADLQPGQSVLIQGAAGGVGHFAVQLAKWRGAHVIGTASDRNRAFLQQLGADRVIDYTTTRFETMVGEVDVVLDAIGGETQQRSLAVLKPGGMLVSLIHDLDPALAAAYAVRQHNLLVEWNGGQLAELARLVDAGQLQPVVSTVLPLQEAAQAHRLSESGHVRGKIVLQVVA